MASNRNNSLDHAEGSRPDSSADLDDRGQPEGAASRTRNSQKRTKTGCLTCRKRRIKCSEERPICSNCVKSRRTCEGYHQRVSFRPAKVDFQQYQNGAASITFPPGTLGMDFDMMISAQKSGSVSHISPRFPATTTQAAPLSISRAAAIQPITGRPSIDPTLNSALGSSNSSGVPLRWKAPRVVFKNDLSQSIGARPARSIQVARGQSSRHKHAQNRSQKSEFLSDTSSHNPTASESQQSRTSFADFRTPYTRADVAKDTSGETHDLDMSLLESDFVSPDQLLREAAIEVYDEDYYDLNSEDEMDIELSNSFIEPYGSQINFASSAQQLGFHQDSLGIPALPGFLDFYRPEQAANPLGNGMTRYVFAHFINITGPTIATFTRRPTVSQAQERGTALPFSQQGVWTHSIPMASLHNQGLLHAILALSSLHIAKLTGSSTTPSYKHYAYALKHIHKHLGQSKKRRSVPTLGASLLLGVYELWIAEHVKWNSHLAGAAQLLAEIDFASTFKEFRRLKKHYQSLLTRHQSISGTPLPRSQLLDELQQIPDVDAKLVSAMSGRVVDYDHVGHVDTLDGEPAFRLQPIDIPRFELQKDLFWFFCKQDLVQSIVSGNPLLMSYSRWTDCPPRTPFGIRDAVYGSFDYLVLMVGRIADFTYRDRKRKLKNIDAHGGKWKPAPGMQFGPPQSARAAPPVPPAGFVASPPSLGGSSPPTPEFYGMAPSTQKMSMPTSYSKDAPYMSRSPESYDDFPDLEKATQEAIEDWNHMKSALANIGHLLKTHFSPLAPSDRPPLPSPFGPALMFHSPDVLCLWSYYYLALILIHRVHPDMPPHMHTAAGVAAFQTREYANDLGRVAAGLWMPPQNGAINPQLCASLCETALPLFFAGIQYRDAAQREWLVTRLFEVERRCGNGTAGVIAEGCQTAWRKAFRAGRGPPYVGRVNTAAQDERVSGVWQYRDPGGPPDPDNITDRRFVTSRPQARLHWAIGVMGMEDDD